MKFVLQYIFVLSMMAAVTLTGLPSAAAESLFESYADRSSEALKSETAEMSESLRETFNEADIAEKQRQIDFADYYANFKKLVRYGAKLANYSDYEENLLFARDKELFRGLPEEKEAKAGDAATDRQAFIKEKYQKMKSNIEEEIDTYVDLINISLDACEIMSDNDLSGFMDSLDNQETIRRYLAQSEAYAKFTDRYKRLSADWPSLARRISAQVNRWQPQAPGANDPIIDPEVTEAVL